RYLSETVDGGLTWQPVSDKYLTAGSIGALAVAPSDPNVVYAGTGESPLRGNLSPGDGLYRSTDAGKTWKKTGLADAGQIAHVAVHPQNADLAYVAVLGHAFGPNAMRGVFRTKDGGKTWDKVLFRNDSTGAIDLALDPVNPRVLYAGLWQALRRPWELVSGGAGSGIFKSTDGGDSWSEMTRNKGLTTGSIGRIWLAVSPLDHDRVAAPRGPPKAINRRHSSITSSPPPTSRTSCAAPSRTTARCALPPAPMASASPKKTGTTLGVGRAVGSPRDRTTLTSCSPGATAASSRATIIGRARPAPSTRGPTTRWAGARRISSIAFSGRSPSSSRRATPTICSSERSCCSSPATRGRAGRRSVRT